MPYQNVAETFPLFDTIAVTDDLPNFAVRPAGWFQTFLAAGSAIDWQFFNQRNIASAGMEYTNLETRDQVPWAFTVSEMTIHFFGPSAVFQRLHSDVAPNPDAWNGIWTALWEADVPKHMGVELWVNQDAKLRINAMMPGSGGGPVVGGYGSLGAEAGIVNPAGTIPWSIHGGGQSNATVKSAYVFPRPIEIPVKAAIAVKLIPSEYIRQLLMSIPGPSDFPITGALGYNYVPCFFGVRVTLKGTRFVQQRGEAHAR